MIAFRLKKLGFFEESAYKELAKECLSYSGDNIYEICKKVETLQFSTEVNCSYFKEVVFCNKCFKKLFRLKTVLVKPYGNPAAKQIQIKSIEQISRNHLK